MFDMQQTRIERVFENNFNLPVLHYTQLLGLAMGLTPGELALKELRVDPTKILETIKIQ
jgi:heterodisulfide reductase subunit B